MSSRNSRRWQTDAETCTCTLSVSDHCELSCLSTCANNLLLNRPMPTNSVTVFKTWHGEQQVRRMMCKPGTCSAASYRWIQCRRIWAETHCASGQVVGRTVPEPASCNFEHQYPTTFNTTFNTTHPATFNAKFR